MGLNPSESSIALGSSYILESFVAPLSTSPSSEPMYLPDFDSFNFFFSRDQRDPNDPLDHYLSRRGLVPI